MGYERFNSESNVSSITSTVSHTQSKTPHPPQSHLPAVTTRIMPSMSADYNDTRERNKERERERDRDSRIHNQYNHHQVPPHQTHSISNYRDKKITRAFTSGQSQKANTRHFKKGRSRPVTATAKMGDYTYQHQNAFYSQNDGNNNVEFSDNGNNNYQYSSQVDSSTKNNFHIRKSIYNRNGSSNLQSGNENDERDGRGDGRETTVLSRTQSLRRIRSEPVEQQPNVCVMILKCFDCLW